MTTPNYLTMKAKSKCPICKHFGGWDGEDFWCNLGLYDGATANPWHTVADGDLPKKSGGYLCSDGEEFIVAYYSDESRCFHNILERYGADYNDWVKYWMKIPILQDKVK